MNNKKNKKKDIMQQTVEITKTLCMGANVMDVNILKTIVRLFRQKYEKTCDEKDGLIVGISRITNLSNVISKDSCHIHFTATLLAQTVKPEKGATITFTPTLILAKGIFGKLYDSISVFVPDEYLTGWTFSGDRYISNVSNVSNISNVSTLEDGEEGNEGKNKKEISKDTPVTVMIHDIKFNTTKYNCICKLIFDI